MPTLRNAMTGVVVSCDDHVAARLGVEWVPVGELGDPGDPPEKLAVPRSGPAARRRKRADGE